MNFNDQHLQRLASVASLRGLLLDSTNVTDDGLREFQRERPDVETYQSQNRAIIVLDKAWASLSYSASMESCPRLRSLFDEVYFVEIVEIIGDGIDDDAALWLRHFSSLRTLWMERSSLTDKGLSNVAELANLVSLDLGDTRITDTGLQSLRALKNLETLNLAGTQVTDTGMDHLSHLRRLRALYLDGTLVGDDGLAYFAGTNLVSLGLYVICFTGSETFLGR